MSQAIDSSNASQSASFPHDNLLAKASVAANDALKASRRASKKAIEAITLINEYRVLLRRSAKRTRDAP